VRIEETSGWGFSVYPGVGAEALTDGVIPVGGATAQDFFYAIFACENGDLHPGAWTIDPSLPSGTQLSFQVSIVPINPESMAMECPDAEPDSLTFHAFVP